MQWRAGTVIEQVRQLAGAVECTVVLDELARRRRCARSPTRRWSAPRSPASGCCSTRRPCSRAWAPAAWRSSWPAPTTSPPTRRRAPGHIVKARYTPMQQMLLAVDEQDSPHHDALAEADDLAGMPVVVADLHSALPAVLAGIRAVRPGAAGRLRHDRRRGAARRLLARRGRAGGCRVARRHGHRRAGVRGRPRGRHDAHRAARRPARRGGRRHRRGAGAGQRRHRHPLGLLRVACADALHAADVLGGRASRRCACRGPTAASGTAASPPQPHGIRPRLLAPADLPVTTLPDPELDALVRAQSPAGQRRAGGR